MKYVFKSVKFVRMNRYDVHEVRRLEGHFNAGNSADVPHKLSP